MNGLQLLEQLRADERFAALPVVTLTVEADIKHVSNAVALKARDYIRKDLPVTELMARMRKHLDTL